MRTHTIREKVIRWIKCFTFRRIFDEKQKAGDIFFQEGVANVIDLSLLKHKGKGHGMMASHSEMEIEKNEQEVLEAS